MSVNESRRDFLKKSSILLGGVAVMGMTGCSQAAPEETAEVPSHPYPCCEFDLDRVEKLGYEGYYENGCCYGVAKALLTELSEKVGAPYTYIAPEIFAKEAREVTKQLNAWYTSTPLPIYQPEIKAAASTISPTVNCSDSVNKFMTAADISDMKDDRRRARCGGVSGDVAKKAAELLNIHFGYMAAPVVEETDDSQALGANEYLGEAEGFGGPVKVKVTMDGDKIAKIDVLSHGETAGISDAAFSTIPEAIIAAQSTEVDAAAGATVSSKAIMAAVNDALSKVGK